MIIHHGSIPLRPDGFGIDWSYSGKMREVEAIRCGDRLGIDYPRTARWNSKPVGCLATYAFPIEARHFRWPLAPFSQSSYCYDFHIENVAEGRVGPVSGVSNSPSPDHFHIERWINFPTIQLLVHRASAVVAAIVVFALVARIAAWLLPQGRLRRVVLFVDEIVLLGLLMYLGYKLLYHVWNPRLPIRGALGARRLRRHRCLDTAHTGAAIQRDGVAFVCSPRSYRVNGNSFLNETEIA